MCVLLPMLVILVDGRSARVVVFRAMFSHSRSSISKCIRKCVWREALHRIVSLLGHQLNYVSFAFQRRVRSVVIMRICLFIWCVLRVQRVCGWFACFSGMAPIPVSDCMSDVFNWICGGFCEFVWRRSNFAAFLRSRLIQVAARAPGL